MSEFEIVRREPGPLYEVAGRRAGIGITVAPGRVLADTRSIADDDFSFIEVATNRFEREGEPRSAVLKYLGYFAREGSSPSGHLYTISQCEYLPDDTQVTCRWVDCGIHEGHELERFYDDKDILTPIEAAAEEAEDIGDDRDDESAVTHELDDQDPNRWGDTTNPRSHDPSHFRYLVYGINAYHRENLIAGLAQVEQDTKHGSHGGDQSIDLSEHPERLGERVSLSMSLIDQDHRATWGAVGLIVEVPKGNLISTSTEDAATLGWSQPWLLEHQAASEIMPAEELLTATPHYDYNEVLAFASGLDGATITLVGFFKKVDQHGNSLSPELSRKLGYKAHELGLPFVKIPQEPEWTP